MSREPSSLLANYECVLSEAIFETYRQLSMFPGSTSLQQRLAWLWGLRNQLAATRGKPLDQVPFWTKMEPYNVLVLVREWDGKTR